MRPAGTTRHPVADQGRMVLRQLYYEQLNFWLNPMAAIFTIGFSEVFLVLLGSSAGHSTSSTLGDVKVIQYYVPGFLAYGVMSTCFNSLATSLVVRREMGLLKRLRLSPLPTWAMRHRQVMRLRSFVEREDWRDGSILVEFRE